MDPGPTVNPALSFPSPTDFRFSELSSREVKLHWTNPAGPVQQYRVVYHSAEDQNPQEVRNSRTVREALYTRQRNVWCYELRVFLPFRKLHENH